MRVAYKTSDDSFISYSDIAPAGTLITQAVADGVVAAEADAYELVRTDAEWATDSQALFEQPVIDAEATRAAAAVTKVADLKTILGLTDQQWDNLKECIAHDD